MMADELTDSLKLDISGSESFFELFCQPCSEDKRYLEAYGFCQDCNEYLCCDCFDIHRKPRPTRHHILLNKNEMPKASGTRSSTSHVAADVCTQRCAKHPNEVIKYHCPIHDVIVCGVCVTVAHITCGVVYIPDMSDGTSNSAKYKKTHEAIGEMVKKVEEIVKHARGNVSSIKGYFDGILNDVQQIMKEMNDLMEILENKMKSEAEVFRSSDTDKMNTTIKQCGDILSDIKSMRSQLEKMNAAKHECKLFVEIRISEEKLDVFQRQIIEYENNCHMTIYAFDRSDSLLDLVKDLRKLIQEHKSRSQDGHKTVTIKRGSQGFGFNIRGGKCSGEQGEDCPILLSKIRNSGQIAKDGRLMPGDQIVSVNGVSMDGLTHKEAANKFKLAKEYVTLRVKSKDPKQCKCTEQVLCEQCFVEAMSTCNTKTVG